MPRRTMLALRAVVAGFACAACLPNDTRPPPGSVLVTVSSDGVAADGIAATETLDGWRISFDKVLVVLGGVSLDGDGCDNYSTAAYTRLFEVKELNEPQKVSITYAVGHCDFGFRASSPNADTLVTAGATESDKAMMRTPGSDAFTDQAGISIYVRGHAVLGEMTKTFEWPFRYRARYDRCAVLPDGGGARGVELTSKAATVVNLEVKAGVLFENAKDPADAQPRFQVFADADSLYGNDDGRITLAELGHVPLSQAGFTDLKGTLAGIDAGDPHWDAGAEATLESYMYLVLFPSMIKYEGNGFCELDMESRGVGS